MNIFIYSDESGVFDHIHNRFYVYGGVLYLSSEDREKAVRMFTKAERDVRNAEHISGEVKAATISNKSKDKLFRSLNSTHKFGVIIHESRVHEQIFGDKKTKQRFLDYAFKIGIKRKFESLISAGIIIPEQVENLYFYADEHTTATNGKYELRESLEREFKFGTFNENYSVYHKPIFPQLKSVDVQFCNSASVKLVRAADIVANKYYYLANNDLLDKAISPMATITHLP